MNAASFLSGLFRCSLEASVVVLLVAAAQWAFRRRLSPQWRCALWLLVIARLVPFSVSSVTSVFNVIPRWSPQIAEASPSTSAANATRPRPGTKVSRPTVVDPAPAADAPATSAPPAAPRTLPADPVSATVSFAASPRPAPFQWTLARSLLAVWLTGAACLIAIVAFLSWKASRRLRRAKPIADARALAVLDEACRRSAVSRRPTLVECAGVQGPALQGLLSPRIVLPAGFLRAFSEKDWLFVFLHELAHVRRRDLWMNWLLTGLQALHWFNPLVWYAFSRWRLDREVAADALALESVGQEESRNYGHTIVRMLEKSAASLATPGLVGIAEDKRQIRHRIRMIAAFAPARRPLVAALVLAGLAVVGLTDAQVPRGHDKAAGSPRTVTFTIVDADSGKPLPGASVLAYPLVDQIRGDVDSGLFTADADGRAQLVVPLDPPWAKDELAFQVQVACPGYGGEGIMWIATGGRVRETIPSSERIALKRGVSVGGTVLDDSGKPVAGATVTLSGSDYSGYTSRNGETEILHKTYPSFDTRSHPSIAVDAQGRWHADDIPVDLKNLQIVVARPEGALATFRTLANPTDASYDRTVSLASLRDGKAVLTLPEGFTIHGRVVDEAGKPVSGSEVRIQNTSDPFHGMDVHRVVPGPDGRFALPHWTAKQVSVSASKPGFATNTVSADVGPASKEVVVELQPAVALRIRVVDEAGKPLRAQFALQPSPLYNWKGSTDADGRATWDSAPRWPVQIGVFSPGLAPRAARLTADGTEHVIVLSKKAPDTITVGLHVVAADTGRPVPRFEVFRKAQRFELLDPLGTDGHFSTVLNSAEFPPGWGKVFTMEVRAAGYAPWISDRLDFVEGDQTIEVALHKGSPETAEPPPHFVQKATLTGDSDPAFRALGEAVVRLLESGDVDAFVKATAPSREEMRPQINPAPGMPANKEEKRLDAIVSSRAVPIANSARELLAIAHAIGLTPGSAKVRLESISSPYPPGKSTYRSGETSITHAFVSLTNMTLAISAIDPKDARLDGKYTLVVGPMEEYSEGWRLQRGLRWDSLPASAGDQSVRDRIRLAAAVSADFVVTQRPLTDLDDPALGKFGEAVAAFVASHDIDAFVNATTPTAKDLEAFMQKAQRTAPRNLDGQLYALRSQTIAGANALLQELDRLGIDTTQAKVSDVKVVANSPRSTILGSVDGTVSRDVQVRLRVSSEHKTTAGLSVDGEYALSFERASRYGGQWFVQDGKMRWMRIPDDLLPESERQHLELENYVALAGKLPPGFHMPDIDMVRLSDSAHVKLSDLRGKIVLVDFWATWCGPCQEPMAALQRTVERHPAWKDRVAVITLSIDDKAKTAADHLARNGWTRAENFWVGPGAWSAAPVKLFRVSGVPTTFIIGPDGRLIQAGHPASLPIEAIIDGDLNRRARSGS